MSKFALHAIIGQENRYLITIAHKKEEQLISLYDYIERAKNSEDYKSSEFLSAKEECVIARHTLKGEIALYESLITLLRRNIASKDGVINESQMEMLLASSLRLRKAASDVVSVLKKASEIELLQANKFDALQVLALINDVPNLVTQELERVLVTLFSSGEEDLKKFTNPETCIFAIAELIKHVTSSITQRIQSINITSIINSGNGVNNGNMNDAVPITLEEVATMINSIPVTNEQ